MMTASRLAATAACLAAVISSASAQQTAQTPSASISARTVGLEKRDGFIPVYLNERTGAVWLELPADSTRVLFMTTLATGLGSNDLGLDRGSGGGVRVARFDKAGERVLVTFENTQYRSSGGVDNRRTVDEGFASSTVAAMPLLAEEGGRLLVDATELVLRDWNDIAGTLSRNRQGTYAVARDRSRAYKPYTKGFADNTEIDVSLTLAASGEPGGALRRFVPDARALNFRQHLTLLRLPHPFMLADLAHRNASTVIFTELRMSATLLLMRPS